MADEPLPAEPSRPAPVDPVSVLPALLRFGIKTGVRPGIRATQNLLDGAVSVTGQLAEVFLGDEDPWRAATAIRGEVVDRTRDSLALTGDADPVDVEPSFGATRRRATPARLKRKGEALLARSADLDVDTDVHPAFDAILDELAPDEARVLRTLGTAGPQPVIDIEARGRVRNRRGTSLARNVGRLGPDSGCRHPERMDSYIDNLDRLGLVRSTTDTVGDGSQYEVLAVQPAAIAATAEAERIGGRARVVKRSVALTAFGAEFFETCLR